MTYLLDTCVLSEFMKRAPDPGVLKFMSTLNEKDTYLSAVSVGEVRKGIALLGRTKRAAFLRDWLKELRRRFQGRIKAFNVTGAEQWGDLVADALKKGRPRPVLDSLIAATAAVDDMTLVTRNVSDMNHMGVRIVNPFGR